MRLVTLDLDGTLIRTTVFEAAARELGHGSVVDYFDRLYFDGLLSLEATFYAEYDLFLDVPIARIHEALASGPWLESIEETVAELREAGLEVWIVTDQPDWAVLFLERWGLNEGVYTATRSWDGCVGPVEEQVFEKWPALRTKLKSAGIAPSQVCHVGNGTNDVPIFEHVGASVAFNPDHATISQAADHTIQSESLEGVAEWIRARRAATAQRSESRVSR